MNKELDRRSIDPQGMLPVQMFRGARCAANTSGACALMLAILEDAVLCVERGHQRRYARMRRQTREAESWMRSDGREWLFSFASICDVLGFDADALRLRLLTDGDAGPAPYSEADVRVA